MKEFWVEYDFVETCHGLRPNLMRSFDTEEAANEFAKTTADGKVVEIKWYS